MVDGGCGCVVVVRFYCPGLNGVCRSEHFFLFPLSSVFNCMHLIFVAFVYMVFRIE